MIWASHLISFLCEPDNDGRRVSCLAKYRRGVLPLANQEEAAKWDIWSDAVDRQVVFSIGHCVSLVRLVNLILDVKAMLHICVVLCSYYNPNIILPFCLLFNLFLCPYESTLSGDVNFKYIAREVLKFSVRSVQIDSPVMMECHKNGP